MMTEWEWRKQDERRRRRRSQSWGAQYVLKTSGLRQLQRDRSFLAFLLLLSLTIAMVMPLLAPPKAQEQFAELPQAQQETTSPRRVEAISYTLPQGIELETQTFTREELLRGKLLLIDEAHPLPADVPAPNTFSIAAYGKGEVPVQELGLQSGRETIAALAELFAAMRLQNANGLMVSKGTQSAAEQRRLQEESVRVLMRTRSPDEAVASASDGAEWPGCSELLQEFTVEIRPQTADNAQVRQTFDRLKWRYGFVDGAKPNRIRYVGRAHAMAMTYLNVMLEEYLTWLHEKGVLCISQEGEAKYLILCQKMQGTHMAVSVPSGAKVEASLDNMGYAVVACELSR